MPCKEIAAANVIPVAVNRYAAPIVLLLGFMVSVGEALPGDRERDEPAGTYHTGQLRDPSTAEVVAQMREYRAAVCNVDRVVCELQRWSHLVAKERDVRECATAPLDRCRITIASAQARGCRVIELAQLTDDSSGSAPPFEDLHRRVPRKIEMAREHVHVEPRLKQPLLVVEAVVTMSVSVSHHVERWQRLTWVRFCELRVSPSAQEAQSLGLGELDQLSRRDISPRNPADSRSKGVDKRHPAYTIDP